MYLIQQESKLYYQLVLTFPLRNSQASFSIALLPYYCSPGGKIGGPPGHHWLRTARLPGMITGGLPLLFPLLTENLGPRVIRAVGINTGLGANATFSSKNGSKRTMTFVFAPS